MSESKIEAAREIVRRALVAADNGNQAGEDAVLAMASHDAAIDVLRETRTDLAVLRRNVINAATTDLRWEGMGVEVGKWIGRIDAALQDGGRDRG